MDNNTAILTEDNGAINTTDFWGYAVSSAVVTDTDGSELTIFNLIACKDHSKANVVISTFYAFNEARQDAVNALASLLKAIDNGDRVWDVTDHNPNL